MAQEKAYPNRKKEIDSLIAEDEKGMKSKDGETASKAYGDYAVHKSWEDGDRKVGKKKVQGKTKVVTSGRKKTARKKG